MWAGEFDLNALRVEGEIFESGKKKLRIQKYPDTSGRGLELPIVAWTQMQSRWLTIIDLVNSISGFPINEYPLVNFYTGIVLYGPKNAKEKLR